MPAKPIIDISVRVKSLKAANECKRKLKKLGFVLHGSVTKSGILFTIKEKTPDVRYIHLTLVYTPYRWNEITLFRDYLLNNKRTAAAYIKLKKKLAKQFPNNRKAYGNGKAKFIKRIVKLARKQRR